MFPTSNSPKRTLSTTDIGQLKSEELKYILVGLLKNVRSGAALGVTNWHLAAHALHNLIPAEHKNNATVSEFIQQIPPESYLGVASYKQGDKQYYCKIGSSALKMDCVRSPQKHARIMKQEFCVYMFPLIFLIINIYMLTKNTGDLQYLTIIVTAICVLTLLIMPFRRNIYSILSANNTFRKAIKIADCKELDLEALEAFTEYCDEKAPDESFGEVAGAGGASLLFTEGGLSDSENSESLNDSDHVEIVLQNQ